MNELNLRQNFRPLLASHLGFDRLFDEMERASRAGSEALTYPPFNIIKEDDEYLIEVAVAGFKKSDIKIGLDRKEGSLNIYTDKIPEHADRIPDVIKENRVFLKRGLARRSFSLTFRIAQDLEVTGAELEDGILTVSLKTVKRPEDEPILINIK